MVVMWKIIRFYKTLTSQVNKKKEYFLNSEI